MSKGLITILLLLASNTFMTIAWYGHLKFKNVGIIAAVAISWGIALLEYSLMVPANKIGSNINGGPFNMFQLKIIQEVVSISVFVIFCCNQLCECQIVNPLICQLETFGFF